MERRGEEGWYSKTLGLGFLREGGLCVRGEVRAAVDRPPSFPLSIFLSPFLFTALFSLHVAVIDLFFTSLLSRVCTRSIWDF